jgi:hypothetical protein
MKILRLFPQVVGATSTLQQRFVAMAKERGLTQDTANSLLSIIPFKLLNASCFLDRLTGLWRYEFGEPFDRMPHDQQVWGAHMWIPVEHLFSTILCASSRLTVDQRRQYFGRLVNPAKHQDVLAEFAPIVHLDPDIRADFEVTGLGVGNHTIDWSIQPPCGPRVLLDVKRRTKDFIEFAARLIAGHRDLDGTAPAPIHDPTLLFQNLEEKFLPHAPDDYLQGVWILTDVKQEEWELSSAFDVLDSQKIHFVILGDWEETAYILARRAVDKRFLFSLFGISESSRFVFSRIEP